MMVHSLEADEHAGKVKMSHVDQAINEMFQATHMQMMRNCCRLEQILLAAILLESRSKGDTWRLYTLLFTHWRPCGQESLLCVHGVSCSTSACAYDAASC